MLRRNKTVAPQDRTPLKGPLMKFLDNLALLVGRILMASLFLPAGVGKAMNLAGFAGMLAGKGLPMPDVLAIAAATVEIGGSILLVIGVLPRLTAFVVGGFTLIAALTSHQFWDITDSAARMAQQNNFFKNIAIIGGLMFYFAAGPGQYALGRRKD
ncbi:MULTISPECIES: DoxX family protein [Azorhizobium]|nr:DoxX family protein [Azorhizobium sp. AG788]TDT91402.1 putative oxidoreductase [Azorhizobium sp. AG788]